MEYPVAYIERPRLYGDRVTFLVRWEDRSVTEEEVSNLIPGSVFLLEQWLVEYEDTIADKLREKILEYF